jgi:hypothetical protein
MLIDKGVTVGEVVTIKLTSGEELIAKLVDDGPMHYKLSKPMVLTGGQQGIGMAPYLFTVNPDKDVRIAKATVTVCEATDKQFADSYISGTTGIAMAR